MKRHITLLAAACALSLGACDTLKSIGAGASVASTPIDTTDYAKAAYGLRATYAGALVVATQYARLPRCSKSPTPPCSDQAVLNVMLDVQGSAAIATKAAETAARTLKPGDPLLKVAVVAAQNSVDAFKQIAEKSIDKQKGN